VTTATARRLAWGIGLTAAVLGVVATVYLGLSWREPLPPGSFGFRGFTLLFVLTFGLIGTLIASRQPTNPIGWIFLGGAVLSGAQELAQDYALYAVPRGASLAAEAAWIPAWIWIPGTGTIVFLLLLFPDGHLLSPRWRWAAWFGGVGLAVAVIGLAFAPGPLENFGSVENPYGVEALRFLGDSGNTGLALYGLSAMLAAASTVLRYRRSTGVQRQQLKWLVVSGLFMAIALSLSFVAQAFSSIAGSGAYLWVSLIVIAAFLSIPVATGIAILQYRLYDVDVVIKKTLVFGIISAFLTAVFLAALAVTLGGIVGGVLVAITFRPVRDGARRIADRLVYGKRATPYEVLTEFSGRIAETYAADDVLPRMADVVRNATGAKIARVWIRVDAGLRPVASSPADAPPLSELPDGGTFPVHLHGEELGALTVDMPANDALDPTREKLVHDLASQAGLLLHNVRLLEELRGSRRRIVTAQDEERRRIERNIHDGAQQQLVALAVKLKLADGLVDRDPARAHEALAMLQADAHEALEDLRDLARGIYPPLLADKGLAAALEAQARKSALPVSVQANGIGRYSSEVEAAVYFSCLEALQNTAKYAAASAAAVTLAEGDGSLSFAVRDDGEGFDPATVARGSGLQGIEDRVAALGGSVSIESGPGRGVIVRGRIPALGRP